VADASAARGLRLLGLAASAELGCLRGDVLDLVSCTEQGLASVDDATDPVVSGWLQELSGWVRFFQGQEAAEENALAGVELLRPARTAGPVLPTRRPVGGGPERDRPGADSAGLAAFTEAVTEANLTGGTIGLGPHHVMSGVMQTIFGRWRRVVSC